MTQPQYGPPQPPRPGWGQPGPYGPPPPKRGMGAGAIIAIVLGSIVALILLVVILGAAVGDNPESKAPARPAAPTPAPTKTTTAPTEEPAADAPVKVTARTTEFTPSVLHDGGPYTSVEVTITNVSSDKTISTNPLNFTITDTSGAKHAAELGMDKNQMDLLKLGKGEKATGIITGKGKFTPAYVTYSDGLFSEGVRGSVS
ncbi:DUF4352 domain-containing protein [Streptomyces sp. NPDC003314]